MSEQVQLLVGVVLGAVLVNIALVWRRRRKEEAKLRAEFERAAAQIKAEVVLRLAPDPGSAPRAVEFGPDAVARGHGGVVTWHEPKKRG